jgi:hypothetical protein
MFFFLLPPTGIVVSPSEKQNTDGNSTADDIK